MQRIMIQMPQTHHSYQVLLGFLSSAFPHLHCVLIYMSRDIKHHFSNFQQFHQEADDYCSSACHCRSPLDKAFRHFPLCCVESLNRRHNSHTHAFLRIPPYSKVSNDPCFVQTSTAVLREAEDEKKGNRGLDAVVQVFGPCSCTILHNSMVQNKNSTIS